MERNSSLEFKPKVLSVRELAGMVKIEDQVTYDLAVEELKAAHALEQEIIKHHEPMKKAAFEAHKTICAQEKSLLAPITEAKAIYSHAIGDWDARQREKEEAERRRLEAEERKRQEEAALAEAEAALAEGASQDEALAILEAPVAAPRVLPAPSYTRAAGIRNPTYYSAEVVNLNALIQAVAKNPAMVGYLLPNMTVINALARAQKEVFNLPGCRLKKETKAGVSGR